MSTNSLASKLAEQHAEIIDALEEDPRHENRRARRFDFRSRGEIFPCLDGRLGEAMPIQLHDFSHRGLSFHTRKKMTAGQQFVFHLPRKDGGTTPVLCTIAYCRRSSEREFRVGAEFTCVVKPDGSDPAAAGSGSASAPAEGDLERIKRSILD